TIREKLPDGFQRSEYLREHGMVDMVVHRHELRTTLSNVLHMLMRQPTPARAVQLPAPDEAPQPEAVPAGTEA
ncbi:MAG: acetyl-CoA carboxylase carboxyl transferase subunit beta, partial [Pseudomonadota bacterium]